MVINFISFNNIFSYSWELNFDAFNKIFKHSVFVDSLTFGTFGIAINGVPKFYMTYDGGITWSQTLTDEECFLEPDIRGGMLSPWALSKASSNKFFIACEKGYILESTNTGKSWSRIKSNIDTNLLQMDMFNDSIGIAASEFTLFYTEDGCNTFQQININYSQDTLLTIWDIIILDSGNILIGATSSELKKNVIFLTRIEVKIGIVNS